METPEHREAPIRVHFGPGFHAAVGRHVDRSAYDRYVGDWSRLFVPAVLAAAEVSPLVTASFTLRQDWARRQRWRLPRLGPRDSWLALTFRWRCSTQPMPGLPVPDS